MNELNTKLAEWAGVSNEWDFTNSLDACFKWLVPQGNITDINFKLDTGGTSQLPSCTIRTLGDDFTGYHEDIKVALCLAVSELIDGGK